MTKPWEENWRLDDANPVVRLHDNEPIAEFEGDEDLGDSEQNYEQNYERDMARARLAACAPEMARLLLELECVDLHGNRCPCCTATQFRRSQVDYELIHKDGCEWLALMKKAGVR